MYSPTQIRELLFDLACETGGSVGGGSSGFVLAHDPSDPSAARDATEVMTVDWDAVDTRLDLLAAIRTLTPQERLAVRFLIEGQNARYIGQQLGLGHTATRTLVTGVLRQLAERMNQA